MLKSSILNYQSYLKNSTWITLWFILLVSIPVAVFCVLVAFETQIAAILVKLRPPAAWQGFAYYTDFVYIARLEILWLGFFFLLALVLIVYPSARSLSNILDVRREKAPYYMMLTASAFFFVTTLVGSKALEYFPNSSDEYAYLFQAEMFSRGKLWERAHDLPDFFYHNNIPQHEGILLSRFPPGWPLILSVAFEIGLSPHLVNPVLGVLTLVAFYFFARRYYGEVVAVWSVLALALSGFYIFNAASYFSHVSCLLVTLLFVYNVSLYNERQKIIYALLAGFFLAFVAIIRYYTAVLIFVPFLIYLIVRYKAAVIRLFFWMGIGGVPCIAYLFWYNYSITGSALIPVTMWAYQNEQLGFVKGHTFWRGIEHVVRRFLMFFYWSSPGLLILYFVFLWRKIKTPAQRLVRPEEYAFFMLLIGYFFYYEIGGNQYGPRFLFEGLPFLVLLVVSNVIERREKWAMAILLASMMYAIIKLPFVADREEAIVDQRKDLYDIVEERGIRNAVVFIASPTSSIRPMPATDLTRNDPRFVNKVLYVLDLPGIGNEILEYYEDRTAYRYVRDLDHPKGELIRIR